MVYRSQGYSILVIENICLPVSITGSLTALLTSLTVGGTGLFDFSGWGGFRLLDEVELAFLLADSDDLVGESDP